MQPARHLAAGQVLHPHTCQDAAGGGLSGGRSRRCRGHFYVQHAAAAWCGQLGALFTGTRSDSRTTQLDLYRWKRMQGETAASGELPRSLVLKTD